MILMLGKEIAEKIKTDLKKEINSKRSKPFLAAILVGNNKASAKYVSIKEKACGEIGAGFELYRLSEKTTKKEIVGLVRKLNRDPRVTGIIIQLPLPKQFDPNEILEEVDPAKDVDGLNSVNIGKLIKNIEGIHPATPEGVITLIKHYNIPLKSKRVVVIGRSNLVGKPIAQLLLIEDATVTIANSKTKNLKQITLESDIIISATGQPKLIKGDMVKKGSTVVDVGTTVIAGKIIGDVDFESVSKKALYITPNPGGVGPMTVAVLLSNLLKAYNPKERHNG